MTEPRAYTAEEVRKIFLEHLVSLARYWADLPDQTPRQKCEGVVFSILTTIDGCGAVLPAMDLVLRPHEDDKEYCRSGGENWFEPDMVFTADTSLHEILHRYTGKS